MLSLTSGTHQTNLYILFLWKHMFVGPDPKVAYVSTFQSISFLEEKGGGTTMGFVVNYCLFSRKYGKL